MRISCATDQLTFGLSWMLANAKSDNNVLNHKRSMNYRPELLAPSL